MSTESLRQAVQRPSIERPSSLRKAGVAVVIDADEQLLLIRRVERVGDPWSGHLALPGGHVHDDESFLEAAIRETQEEVSIDLHQAEHLGALDDLGTPSKFATRWVRPHVFVVDTFEHGVPDPSEVAALHRVALVDLLTSARRSEFELVHDGTTHQFPAVDVDGHRLWGMTLRILDDLTDRLRSKPTE